MIRFWKEVWSVPLWEKDDSNWINWYENMRTVIDREESSEIPCTKNKGLPY